MRMTARRKQAPRMRYRCGDGYVLKSGSLGECRIRVFDRPSGHVGPKFNLSTIRRACKFARSVWRNGGVVGEGAHLSIKSPRKHGCAHHIALQLNSAVRFFISHDQAVAVAMLIPHDNSCEFRERHRPTGFGAGPICARFSSPQQGRHCRGPYLENECARRVRRVRFRWRDLAGGILSSRGRRRRQPTSRL